MPNFLKEILATANGEEIQAVVFGESSNREFYDTNFRIPQNMEGVLLSFDEAEPYLNYNYTGDFGFRDCYSMTVWTANKIIFVSNYDGGMGVDYIPRNPTAYIPRMPGGG